MQANYKTQYTYYSEPCVLRTLWEYPDYQGVLILQVNLHANGYFGTINKCPDYTSVLIFKYPDKQIPTVQAHLQ